MCVHSLYIHIYIYMCVYTYISLMMDIECKRIANTELHNIYPWKTSHPLVYPASDVSHSVSIDVTCRSFN